MSNEKDLKHRYQRDFKQVRKILMEKWDPIGVKNSAADPKDVETEYDRYVEKIISMMEHLPSDTEIADYLRKVEVEQMGLPDSAKSGLPAAKALLDFFESERAEEGS